MSLITTDERRQLEAALILLVKIYDRIRQAKGFHGVSRDEPEVFAATAEHNIDDLLEAVDDA